jgi:hypothetical protein
MNVGSTIQPAEDPDGTKSRREEAHTHMLSSSSLGVFLLLPLSMDTRLQILQPINMDLYKKLSRWLPVFSLELGLHHWSLVARLSNS